MFFFLNGIAPYGHGQGNKDKRLNNCNVQHVYPIPMILETYLSVGKDDNEKHEF